MSTYPERIWLAEYRDGEDSEPTIEHEVSDPALRGFGVPDSYNEYIRADLLPQWQPIETIDGSGVVVALATKNGFFNMGSFYGGLLFIFGKDGPIDISVFDYWMPLPELPK